MTKKTDFEKMTKMLDKAGIGYETNGDFSIELHAQDHNKVNGYPNFTCEFIFVKGKLDRAGVWE